MDKNLYEFDNTLQHFIWKQEVNLVPIEKSTALIEDNKIKQSCYELFHYIYDGFENIYKNPQVYGLNPDEKVNGAIEDRICFHRTILESFLDIALEVQIDFILINADAYDLMLKKIKMKWKQNKVLPPEFSFENQMDTLKQIGLIINRNDSEIKVTNNIYPNMFLSAKLLRNATILQYQKTKRSSQNFILCDFRSLQDFNRKVDLEDILDPCRDKEKELSQRIFQYMNNKNIQIKKEYNFFYYRFAKFEYKKKDLFFFRWNSHHYSQGFELGLCLPGPGSQDYDMIQDEINKLDNADEIKDFCVNNMRYCIGCNANCVRNNAFKKKWVIFERPVKGLIASCGGALVTVNKINENAFEIIKVLLDIHIRVINCSGFNQ